MNIKDFRQYLLKNLAVFSPDTAHLACKVVDRLDTYSNKKKMCKLSQAAIERVIGSLSAVLILKFERKIEEKLTVALKKIITLL